MKHRDYKTDPTYKTWNGMKDRCTNPNNPRYKDYGGRGITYDPRWAVFDNFLKDMGERPEGTTLDRINNNGGYYKANCQWLPKELQQRNTRRSQLTNQMVATILLARQTSELSSRELARQLAEIFSVKAETVREVLKRRTWK